MQSFTASIGITSGNKVERRFGRESAILVSILALSGLLNFWNLSVNGWANAYYSAAVQAGMHNREAFLFGSSDWGNSISVDKPPLSLWLMGISVRLFGLNAWGILIPEALLGVGSTLCIYLVARRLSAASGIVAALVFCTTPVVVLMSRYNNPDMLMVFLMLASLAVSLRALESHSIRWAALSGVLLGLAVLTKQLQALFVAPSLAVLILGALKQERKLAARMALGFGVAFTLVSASWFAILSVIPASDRPYLGSTTSNNPLELTFGFNGLDRFTGISNPGASLMPMPSESQTDAGAFRLLDPNNAQEIGWLLPAAFVALLLLFIAKRWSSIRPGLPLVAAVSVWFLLAYGVLSFMGNGYHTYYSLSLAPPLALVVGAAVHAYIEERDKGLVRWLAGLGVLTATCTAWLILGLLSEPPGLLRAFVLATGMLSAAMVIFRPPNRMFRGIAYIAVSALLLSPVASDCATLNKQEMGAGPSAGASVAFKYSPSKIRDAVESGDVPTGIGDLTYGRSLPPRVMGLLSRAPTSCVWDAATLPAQSAANVQLALGRAVMPLGGYQATDPWPTSGVFRSWVAQGKVCYLIDQPALDPVATDQTAAGGIVRWVRSNFKPSTVDGVVIYDLRAPLVERPAS